ncbi:MAG: GntR family transcriptional regulator [Legionella sp.]|nr:MAG: GntR family transcriptional regulator [Legionella sp.]PJD98507.1 MAG: GntR family transcriptional regulator [Legionella sp.]
MIEIGKWNTLTVIKEVPFGVYLDGGSAGDILLPKKAVPKGTTIDDKVKVFIYFDSEDMIIATTRRPYAQVGDIALLKVADVNMVGAFLDWGLDKDLLVPRAEQQRPMEKGKAYLVYVKQDHRGRIVASSKLNYCLDQLPLPSFKPGQEVNLIIEETTPLGRKVIINNSYWGLIHEADIFQTLHYGHQMPGYIKAVRDDNKIDVALRKMGQNRIHELASRLLLMLQEQGGFLPLHDKSDAAEIKRLLGDSKSSFKSAIGHLYKQGKIIIEAQGIRLTAPKD